MANDSLHRDPATISLGALVAGILVFLAVQCTLLSNSLAHHRQVIYDRDKQWSKIFYDIHEKAELIHISNRDRQVKIIENQGKIIEKQDKIIKDHKDFIGLLDNLKLEVQRLRTEGHGH